MLPACRAFGLGLIPYFPLESGFLTGKYAPGTTPADARLAAGPRASAVLTDENFRRLERLRAIATAAGHSLLDLAMGWLLSHTEVASVISGASGPEQVVANVEASGWRLSQGELEAVAAID